MFQLGILNDSLDSQVTGKKERNRNTVLHTIVRQHRLIVPDIYQHPVWREGTLNLHLFFILEPDLSLLKRSVGFSICDLYQQDRRVNSYICDCTLAMSLILYR